jgi:hypothetical protein
MSASINDPAAAFSGEASEVSVQEVQVDVTKLNALSPEVISKQATVSRTLLLRCHLNSVLGVGGAFG